MERKPYSEFNGHKFRTIPQWVRKLCEDQFGVQPDNPAFIREYIFDKPLQDIMKQVLDELAGYDPDAILAMITDLELLKADGDCFC